MTYQFKTNINCGGCIAKIAPLMNGNSSISSWKVDTASADKILTVETENLSENDVTNIVKSAGFSATKF